MFASPDAANNNTCARRTCRCGALVDLANTSNVSRWAPDNFNAAAGRFTPPSYHNQIAKNETLH
jgi:hypothetical protein